MKIAATPMAFVRAVVLAYEKGRRDPAAALAEAHISPQQLRQVDGRVTAAQFEALCDYAMRELDDEALGWFSRPLRWGSYGLLSRASLHAPNLGVALARWCRHHRLLCNDIRHVLTVTDGVATLSLEELAPLGATREFCLVSCLRFVHGYACWAIDSRLSLREASFPFPAPAHGRAYPLMFSGELRFAAPRAAFSFDAEYLALPLRRDEAALSAMLKRPLPLTVLQYRRDRLLVQQVRGQLLRSPSPATADSLAAALHVSVRTLHRQLQEEGASLQSLKDEVRRERAIEQLRRSTRPVKQIAQDVGFRNEKSFSRAFKGWTGQSPGEFRAATR
jgi:AraC-like DNA-binding protein